MITTLGKNLVRDLIIGDNTASITFIEIGTNGTAATVTDTAITDAYGETATITYPDAVTALFSVSVTSAEANGSGTVNYQEIGLLTTSGGVLMSRTVFLTKTKDSSITFNLGVVLDVIS